MSVDEKIKLVIWDLDDTLWKGVLAEGDDVEPYMGRFDTVRRLNLRGIVNAIVSKNRYDDARRKLESMSVWDDFVFPRISFNPKGPVIKQLISDMSLRPVNVLFIDDNDSNLNEAEHFCPGINTLNASECDGILDNPFLAGKDDSALSRLEQYRQLEKRVTASQCYSSNEEFLRHCNIRAEIVPYTQDLFDRAYELIERTNQLNYTKRRPTAKEFRKYLEKPDVECNLVHVVDDFGDNGFVGITVTNKGKLEHFAFSCRILGYHVEQWMYARLGHPDIEVVGEVAIPLNKTDHPDYITLVDKQTEKLDIDGLHPEGKTSVCVYGACYMQSCYSFFRTAMFDTELRLSLTSEQNYRFDSAAYLATVLTMTDEERVTLLSKERFSKYAEFFEKPDLTRFDYVFLGLSEDYHFEFAYLKDHPGVRLNRDLLGSLGKKPGLCSAEALEKNLETVFGHLGDRTKLILMVHPDHEVLKDFIEGRDNDRPFCEWTRYTALNKTVRDFIARHGDRVIGWDAGLRVTDRECCTNSINHWTVNTRNAMMSDLVQLILDDRPARSMSDRKYTLVTDSTMADIKMAGLRALGYNVSDVVSDIAKTPAESEYMFIIDMSDNATALRIVETIGKERCRKVTDTDEEVSDKSHLYQLGKMYENGDGVVKDRSKAIEYYRKAGNIATYRLANLLYQGDEDEIDEAFSMAYEYLTTNKYGNSSVIGDTGDRIRMHLLLSNMYAKGKGVEKNLDLAINQAYIAQSRGRNEEKRILGLRAERGNQEDMDYLSAYFEGKSYNDPNAPVAFYALIKNGPVENLRYAETLLRDNLNRNREATLDLSELLYRYNNTEKDEEALRLLSTYSGKNTEHADDLKEKIEKRRAEKNKEVTIVRGFFDNYEFLPDETTYYAQNTCLKLYDVLKKLCDENDIRFWAYGGTLIGAVRHGGYVPWDDDMDLMMPREDLKKLKKALEKNKEYFIDESFVVTKPMRLYRFKKRGVPLFIDIAMADCFTSDETADALKERFEENMNRRLDLHSTLVDVVDKKDLSKLFDNLATLSIPPSGKDGYVSIGVDSAFMRNSRLNTFPVEDVFPLRSVPFGEGREMYIPNNALKYAKAQFGDFLTPVLYREKHTRDIKPLKKFVGEDPDMVFADSLEEEYNTCMNRYRDYLLKLDKEDTAMLWGHLTLRKMNKIVSSGTLLKVLHDVYGSKDDVEAVKLQYALNKLRYSKKQVNSFDITKYSYSSSELRYLQAEAYLEGVGVEKDLDKAISILKVLALENNGYLLKYLEVMVDNGRLNKNKVDNLMRLCTIGYSDAYRIAGKAYLKGNGVKANFDKACEWFKRLLNRKETNIAPLLVDSVMAEKGSKEACIAYLTEKDMMTSNVKKYLDSL
ncbi:MAG: LicD family protein [archaeon]|nr:LicD family protein [archaeon]